MGYRLLVAFVQVIPLCHFGKAGQHQLAYICHGGIFVHDTGKGQYIAGLQIIAGRYAGAVRMRCTVIDHIVAKQAQHIFVNAGGTVGDMIQVRRPACIAVIEGFCRGSGGIGSFFRAVYPVQKV